MPDRGLKLHDGLFHGPFAAKTRQVFPEFALIYINNDPVLGLERGTVYRATSQQPPLETGTLMCKKRSTYCRVIPNVSSS